jgi:hypothetical protein
VRSANHMCQWRKGRRAGDGTGGNERDQREGSEPDTTGRHAYSKRSMWVGHPTPQFDETLRHTSAYKIEEIACPQFPLLGLDVGEEGHFVSIAISPRPRERSQEPVPESHAVTLPLIRVGPEGCPVNVLALTRR